MKQILICRRTFIALASILALSAIAIVNHIDVSTAIASIAVALGASNAVEGALKSKFENPPKES